MKLTTIVFSTVLAAGLANPAAAHRQAIDLLNFDQFSGYGPWSGVIADSQGQLFGTNPSGGNGSCDGGEGCGTIYALKPPAKRGASWKLQVLYNFQNQGDGWFPEAPVTLGPEGSLFGYPTAGSYGTVFQLVRPVRGSKAWTYNVLYTFTNGTDGNLLDVIAPLVWRGKVLYGIASGGSDACGQTGCGSVFRLPPPQSGSGSWSEKTLVSFTGGTTGGQPAAIIPSRNGNSFYVASDYGNGAVFEIAPAGHGTWTETALTVFKGGDDGSAPSNLVLAANGTIYGIANQKRGGGLVFQLTLSNGTWTRTNIADVSFHGYGPVSLAPGANGTLIGVVEGDFDFFAGNVFQLASSGGTWTVKQLWNFNHGPDRNPEGVVAGSGGHLYGTLFGGDSDSGSVFELK
ncbi:MAG TPA: hypothetical protein VGL35_02330 [Rhizomicrobium sp.]|jgi:hypothetical protein